MLINKLFMILKLSSTFVPFLIFMKASMKSKLNNSLNLNLLKSSNLGVPLFILMILNLSLVNGLKETKKILFSILLMSTLTTSTSQYFNKFIVTSKWDPENPHNKSTFVMNNMLNSRSLTPIDFSNKKCMMR